jgi:hypothetical protein
MATAAQTDRTRKKGRDLFLASLASTGNVGLSVSAAGVGRSTVYEWREKDEGFAQEWENALKAGIQMAKKPEDIAEMVKQRAAL